MTARFQDNHLHKLVWLNDIELFEANRTSDTYGRHAHSGFAIGSITAGVGGYWCRGATHVLPQYTLSLMNPEEPHTGYAVDANLRYKMLYVSETAVREILDFNKLMGFSTINPKDHTLQIGYQLNILANMLNGTKMVPEAAMWIEERVHYLLGLIFTCYGAQSLRGSGDEPQAIRRAIEVIEGHVLSQPAEPLTITRLADAVGLRPNYLIQSFSRVRGISPHAFLMYRKICKAKQLIAAGDHMTDVALSLGFYDQSHFIRHFRKIIGVTPGAMIIHRKR